MESTLQPPVCPVRVIGLTGGIGMGKSTAASAFRRAHIPVFDADRVVHRLQAAGGAAVPAIAAAFPGTVQGGAVDRARLRAALLADPASFPRLERIVHPLVRREESRFLARARRQGRRLAVLDIPLLLETGGERCVDTVLVVSAPPAIQRARLRARGLPDAAAAALIGRQMPDAQKRRRADIVLRTGLSRHHAQRHLRRLIQSWQP